MENPYKKCPNCGERNIRSAMRCKKCKEWFKFSIEEENYNSFSYELPYELQRFNWGAFFFTWIWGLFNNSYLTLLYFIVLIFYRFPILSSIISLIFWIWFGICGNRWAWENKRWKSIKHFNDVQRTWATAGTILFGICFLIVFIFIGIIQEYYFDLVNVHHSVSYNQSNGLKLINARKCYLDYGVRGVCGTIKNNSSYMYSYVQVEINLYDSNGVLVGSTLSNINNFHPGQYWKFEAIVLDYDATNFKIENITGF